MKFEISQKIVALTFVFVFALIVFSCQSSTPAPGGNSGSGGAATTTAAAQTPTEAYKMLYAAVKSKDAEKIRQVMSKDSIGLAEMQAGRSNQPIEKVLANGFTETTFAAAMPQIRDERVQGEYGAIEVWNEKTRQWEDLPFVREDGNWKLAVGNLFSGKYESPGKSQSFKEREAANLADPNHGMIPKSNTNANGNVAPIKKIQFPPAANNAVNGALKK